MKNKIAAISVILLAILVWTPLSPVKFILSLDDWVTHSRRDPPPEWHDPVKAHARNAVTQGKLVIGINESQAIEVAGWPEKRNKTVTQYRVSEQWVYPDGKFLYFENGVLTSLQTSE